MTITGLLRRAEGRMPELDGATGWLNTEPLTADALRGHVVLVQFWTYTCINWLRTLPYVRAWDRKYRDHGLVVLGVHTPEFTFERDPENVRHAVAAMDIPYPVAIDSEYAVWEAFDNHYWPALYVVDATGRIRHHRFGEGDFQQTEMVLRRLLAEAGAEPVAEPLVMVEGDGLEAPADWDDLVSGESYVGYSRGTGLASPVAAAPGERRRYSLPGSLWLDQWALVGEWTVQSEAAVLAEAGGRIAYRFHARDLHLVMGPPDHRTPVPFRIRLDGEPPQDAHGDDVDEEGDGLLTEQRLHQLVRQRQPIRDRTFEIEFLEPGASAVVFTFG